MGTVTYQSETPESVATHEHPAAGTHVFQGKSPEWYASWGGACPTCKVVPVFETLTEEREPTGTGLGVFGLSSGERVNRVVR